MEHIQPGEVPGWRVGQLDTPIRSTTTLLVYDDLPAAHAYLADTFGLTPGSLERDPDGRAVHSELFAGDQSIWLHPSGNGYRSPRELGGVSSMIVVGVEDADAHCPTPGSTAPTSSRSR